MMIFSCKNNPLEMRVGNESSSESADQTKPDAVDDDEGVSIPKNITGSFLACELTGDDESQETEVQFGCRLADESTSQKTSITEILQDWDWSYQTGLSDIRVVVEPIEDSESPWHVIYRLDTSRHDVETIKREVYVGLVHRISGASMLRPIIETTANLNLLLQGQWVEEAQCLLYATLVVDVDSTLSIYSRYKVFLENGLYIEIMNYYLAEDCSGRPLMEERTSHIPDFVRFDGYQFDIDFSLFAWTIRGNNDLGADLAQRFFPCQGLVYEANLLSDITSCHEFSGTTIPVFI